MVSDYDLISSGGVFYPSNKEMVRSSPCLFLLVLWIFRERDLLLWIVVVVFD